MRKSTNNIIKVDKLKMKNKTSGKVTQREEPHAAEIVKAVAKNLSHDINSTTESMHTREGRNEQNPNLLGAQESNCQPNADMAAWTTDTTVVGNVGDSQDTPRTKSPKSWYLKHNDGENPTTLDFPKEVQALTELAANDAGRRSEEEATDLMMQESQQAWMGLPKAATRKMLDKTDDKGQTEDNGQTQPDTNSSGKLKNPKLKKIARTRKESPQADEVDLGKRKNHDNEIAEMDIDGVTKRIREDEESKSEVSLLQATETDIQSHRQP
ncbi:hypothetical protein PTKIN_Ptkin11bG0120900 [Pterospermum kingtungense]